MEFAFVIVYVILLHLYHILFDFGLILLGTHIAIYIVIPTIGIRFTTYEINDVLQTFGDVLIHLEVLVDGNSFDGRALDKPHTLYDLQVEVYDEIGLQNGMVVVVVLQLDVASYDADVQETSLQRIEDEVSMK